MGPSWSVVMVVCGVQWHVLALSFQLYFSGDLESGIVAKEEGEG